MGHNGTHQVFQKTREVFSLAWEVKMGATFITKCFRRGGERGVESERVLRWVLLSLPSSG